jgi:hypothetical protein
MGLTRRRIVATLGAGGSGAFGQSGARKTEKPVETRRAAVLVCGGGPAGIAAALMAARGGAETLLVERYGRLGGMAVQAMVGPMMGRVKSPVADEIMAWIKGPNVNYETVDLAYAELLQKAGVRILLHSWITGTLVDGRAVAGVELIGKQGGIEVRAQVTIDATGDGDVAYCAGAPFEMGRSDGLLQPMSIMFRAGGVKHEETMEAKGGRAKYRFPDGRTWVQLTADALERKLLPPNVGFLRTYMSVRTDERVINATQINRVDGTRVGDLTRAEFEGRRQAVQVMEFLTQHAPGFQNAYISGMPAIVGVRETRRILGAEYLTAEHLLSGKKWPDAVVRGADFIMDVHNPVGAGQAARHTKENPMGRDPAVKPYDIPYGCLLPRNVDNLLVAGRCISGSHEAHASYRVQRIALAIGAAAGAAAAEAVRQKKTPREIDVSGVQRRLFA